MPLFLLQDGIVNDGLTDVYDRIHMGNCAEKTSREVLSSFMEVSPSARDHPRRPGCLRNSELQTKRGSLEGTNL